MEDKSLFFLPCAPLHCLPPIIRSSAAPPPHCPPLSLFEGQNKIKATVASSKKWEFPNQVWTPGLANLISCEESLSPYSAWVTRAQWRRVRRIGEGSKGGKHQSINTGYQLFSGQEPKRLYSCMCCWSKRAFVSRFIHSMVCIFPFKLLQSQH